MEAQNKAIDCLISQIITPSPGSRGTSTVDTSLLGTPAFRERLLVVMKNRLRLIELLKKPLVPQRSPEWYELRRGRLTASDLAQSMDKGKFGNRAQLVIKKAFPERDTFAEFPTKAGTIGPLKWGTMFEPCALRCYIEKHGGVGVHDFGLIPHPTIAEFGASPDGISDVGIMIELKCPWKRKIIKNEVPEQYFLQIQGQLAVCDLDECDYLECDIQRFDSPTAYEAFDYKGEPHGAVIEFKDKEYLYSPDGLSPVDVTEWVENNIQAADPIDVHYWRERDYNLVRIPRDAELFASLVPHIKGFWADVEAARQTGFQEKIETNDDRVKREKREQVRDDKKRVKQAANAPQQVAFRNDDD